MIRNLAKKFSMQTVPQVDLTSFINSKNLENCKKVAESFHKFGALAIKDPRVSFQKNEKFLDLMETYFEDRSEKLANNETIEDIFPEHGYNVGLTPTHKEKARLQPDFIQKLNDQNLPLTPQPSPFDHKYRFMYPLYESSQSEIDGDKYIPKDLPNFKEIMDDWSSLMMQSVNTVAQMAALGFDIEENFFVDKLKGGAHILAPTGSDLIRNKEGDVFAGLHYDFNFMTIHGKSRFPGLFIWLNDGTKIPVKIPDGYLLLQSGKQFEIFTGGYVQCGMHEVIYTPEVTKKVQQVQKETGKKSIFRVSSTLFAHTENNTVLKPLDKFLNESNKDKYTPMTSYELKEQELSAIGLLQIMYLQFTQYFFQSL